MYRDLIKNNYKIPTVNIILNGDEHTLPLKLGTKQGCPLSPLLFNNILDILISVKRQWNKKIYKYIYSVSKALNLYITYIYI